MSMGDKASSWVSELRQIDFNDLDPENPGIWPRPVKVLAYIAAFLLCLVLGYYFVLKSQIEQLDIVKAKEVELRKEYEKKAFEAANLDALREQMVEMEATFGALVSQLPSDTEVPGLLEDITAKGVDNGLELRQIELQPEQSQEFYIELPINIEAVGAYHDLGAFVSGISSLPRIVTLHDFSINPEKERPGILKMNIVAKTYRYKSED